MAVAILSTSAKGCASKETSPAAPASIKQAACVDGHNGGPELRHARPPTWASTRPASQEQPRLQQEPATAYYSICQFTQKVELYNGSVATVYQAVDISSGQRVVIKAYHKDKMQPKHHHKLQREIEAMVAMNGSFVAELYSTFSDSACIYLVMEHCEGGDLFKTFNKHGGRLDEHYVCVEIVIPLLRVLEKMHALHIIHRDIKPENIFLTRRGRLRLGDFGLAINCGKELPFSRSGTLDYMAPEVLQNPATHLQESPSVDLETLAAKRIKPFTSAVDVWAVGVLAYELVCGRPPFEVEDEVKTVTQILYSNNIRFPSCFSPQWCDFVRHALIKDPQHRPDARTLLQHPWCQSHLQRAIACAPTMQHRQSKEDLQRHLSLTPRPMRLPAARTASSLSRAAASPGPSTAAAAGPGPVSVAMPSTPQPKRPAPDSEQHVLQYLHSHFSSMSCAEGGQQQQQHSSADGAAAGAPQHQRVHQQQQQAPPLSPQQHLQQHLPYTPTPHNPSYQASPLSKRNVVSYTPTKSHPSAALEQGHRGGGAEAAAGAQQGQKQQAAFQAAAAALAAAAPDSFCVGEMDVELVLEGAEAHGFVHIVRAGGGKPAMAKSPDQARPQQAQQAATPARHHVAALKSLYIPVDEPVAGQQQQGQQQQASSGSSCSNPPTPGPAGPGIKERLKWHLSRQAGHT